MLGVRIGIKKENRGILSKSLSNGKGVDRRIMTELDANKKAEELLNGAYDLHVHSSPSVFPRELDGFQLVREAEAAGMAGVMLKSHYESTALRAELINCYSVWRALPKLAGRRLECIRGEKCIAGGGKDYMDANPGCEKQPGIRKHGGRFLRPQGYYHSGTGWNIKRMRL